jgi:uncharacterized membrane protein YGL010W
MFGILIPSLFALVLVVAAFVVTRNLRRKGWTLALVGLLAPAVFMLTLSVSAALPMMRLATEHIHQANAWIDLFKWSAVAIFVVAVIIAFVGYYRQEVAPAVPVDDDETDE